MFSFRSTYKKAKKKIFAKSYKIKKHSQLIDSAYSNLGKLEKRLDRLIVDNNNDHKRIYQELSLLRSKFRGKQNYKPKSRGSVKQFM